MNNQRTGKIARMIFEDRTRINVMIRDNRPYAEIIAFARERDVSLNETNVSNWKDGGYEDWRKQQERLEDMRLKREFAMEIVKQNEGGKLHEASLQLAASQIYEVLADFDPQAIKDALKGGDADLYSQLVNSLAKLSKGALEIEKFKDNVRERKAAIERTLGAAKKGGGLTQETIEEIEQQLRML